MSKFNVSDAIKNMIDEYKKIYWPNRSEVFHVTIIVLLITLFIALYILVFDNVFDLLLNRLTQILKSFLGGR
ncbi:preprotein translocase subunit SecE [Pseudoleptotrichia goodfellowii]|nr:preprotein translocase subunit SecE [Pseudoleptotrichia goodfellowii]MBF4806043.1 preprotein translocase subunit SecE [Pseudoleptotrichia goodfellowii]BBM36730.1 preprotein translocase, SecE subunit [Pseudoleptotrichia goodfellowii]